jgi:FkbM family methyltransferase
MNNSKKQELISYILMVENKFDIFMKDYKKNNFKVLLYGNGQGAEWAIRLFNKHKVYPVAIIDKEVCNNVNIDIPVLSLQEALKIYTNDEFRIVISSPRFSEEIKNELKKHINNELIYNFECELYYSYIFDIEEYKSYLIENIDNIMELYNNLEDDFSRITLENVIEGRLSGDLEYFKKVFVPNQYFCENIIKLSNDEVFLDIGACDGDSLKDIVKRTNGKFKAIYCFEPDKQCLIELNKTKEKIKLPNINIIDKGAWDRIEIFNFSSDSEHGASKIVEDENNLTNNTIETVQIDDIVKEKVTFIKMDIEGAELNALKGAKNIISKYKPTLAICVYHKNEDFIEISKYIRSLVPNYKLFIRHHNISGTETVLYAII